MELSKAISLIQHPGIPNNKTNIWADLGCGSGLFTTALATLLAPDSMIYAVDTNVDALRGIKQPKDISIEKIKEDFIKDDLKLNNLDGILMANSLHFVKDKISFIKKTDRYFAVLGCFLIVEYDMETPNTWVPYPISFHYLKMLFEKRGYESVEKINEISSRYNRAGIYSALIR